MIISLIAAMGRNHVIGNKNTLPWRLPADLKHFRATTWGKPLIMGRATMESIGMPLSDRINIVLTQNENFFHPGYIVVHSLEDAIRVAGHHEEVMVIGGASIFQQFLPYATRMYLTFIDEHFDGDTEFPKFDGHEWKELERQEYSPDEKNPYHYTFVTLQKNVL